MATAANATSPWLFPRPPRRSADHHPTTPHPNPPSRHPPARRPQAALRDLLLTVPVPVVASVLGYDLQTLEHHRAHAGSTWVTYVSYRSAADD